MVRQGSAKPSCPGSNPGAASILLSEGFLGCGNSCKIEICCRGGEIGRRKGLKILRTRVCAGSSPALGTKIFYYLKKRLDKSYRGHKFYKEVLVLSLPWDN